MKPDRILNFFPVPSFLDLPNVGIDTSDNFVRFVCFERSKNNLSLSNYGEKILLPDAATHSMEAGVFDDHLRAALLEIKNKNNLDAVNAVILEENAYFLRLRFPGIEIYQVREAIELQLEQHVPYKLKEVVFDYEIVSVNEVKKIIEASVCVVPKLVVVNILSLLRKAGYEVVSLSVESDAAVRALVPNGYEGTCIVANIGKTRTVISIVTEKNVWISDTFKFGGDYLTNLIRRQIGVSANVAIRLKYDKGLTESSGNPAFEPLALGLSSLRDEIMRHYDYWQSSHEGLISKKQKVSDIFLAGREAAIPGLADYLSVSLRIKSSVGDPWVNVIDREHKYIPEMTKDESMDFTVAIGLALSNLVS